MRCRKCGTKVGNMQVHTEAVCERAQKAAGLPPPSPLTEWPEERRPSGKLEDLIHKARSRESGPFGDGGGI